MTTDWLPTLLAAAGSAPDSHYPSDGENLLPVLTGAAPAHSRTLYWRYKSNDQAAVRDGNWKYLKLGGREHLFDIEADPRERAELREGIQKNSSGSSASTPHGTRKCCPIRRMPRATT